MAVERSIGKNWHWCRHRWRRKADVEISGCTFGPLGAIGTVQLVLGSEIEGNGQTLPMNVTEWDDTTIIANLPKTPGLLDQPATLVVTTLTGQQTSFPVQFYQNRVLKLFSVSNPSNFVAAASTAQTTYDKFYLLGFNDGTTSPAADHYTFCCSTVSGVDEWFIKLANGWRIPAGSGAYLVEHFDIAEPLRSGQLRYIPQPGRIHQLWALQFRGRLYQ